MTDALDAITYLGGSSGVPLFEPVEAGRLRLSSIGFAGMLTVLFGVCLMAGMNYEMRHPMVMPWARGQVDEPKTIGRMRPEVVFTCAMVDRSRMRVEARVKQIPSLPAPSGQVRFLVGYQTLKLVKVEDGVATVTVKLSAAQMRQSFRALYLGDDSYLSSYSNVMGAPGR